MAETFPLFEVPIIGPDLRQEETLIQIADCLDYLNEVTNTIFNCINARINENKMKVNDIQKRVSVAKLKVDKLKGVKKATQIFSTSKYPASDIHRDYLSVFKGTSKVLFYPSNFKISEKRPSVKDGTLAEEKLQFFQVKGSRSNTGKNAELKEGLGKLPNVVESASSLLLFNTSENPYERYVTLDPMGVVNKIRKNVQEEAFQKMEDAPISITKQEQLDEQVKESYFYLPSLGDVPNIDAPLDLPDLPGIADDLRYSLDLGPGFAPSVTTTPAIPDLPTIPETSFKDILSNITVSLPDESAMLTSLSLPENSAAAPPPPPPPPPFPPIPVVEFLASPPPPPPPPPSSLLYSEATENETDLSKKNLQGPAVMHVTSNDARADLMAAIRSAGGKSKLKPVQSGRDESKRLQEERNLALGGGDLMADLHNKLLMRRKGISGKGKVEVASTESAMDKISAMIPPPVQQDASSATEDDEWEE